MGWPSRAHPLYLGLPHGPSGCTLCLESHRVPILQARWPRPQGPLRCPALPHELGLPSTVAPGARHASLPAGVRVGLVWQTRLAQEGRRVLSPADAKFTRFLSGLCAPWPACDLHNSPDVVAGALGGQASASGLGPRASGSESAVLVARDVFACDVLVPDTLRHFEHPELRAERVFRGPDGIPVSRKGRSESPPLCTVFEPAVFPRQPQAPGGQGPLLVVPVPPTPHCLAQWRVPLCPWPVCVRKPWVQGQRWRAAAGWPRSPPKGFCLSPRFCDQPGSRFLWKSDNLRVV